MKKLVSAFLIIFVLVAFSGCKEEKVRILEKDGTSVYIEIIADKDYQGFYVQYTTEADKETWLEHYIYVYTDFSRNGINGEIFKGDKVRIQISPIKEKEKVYQVRVYDNRTLVGESDEYYIFKV